MLSRQPPRSGQLSDRDAVDARRSGIHRFRSTKFLEAIKVPGAFAIFAFLYSFLSLLHPEARVVIPEYARPEILVEISGHVAFGLIAAALLLNARLLVLTGLGCMLIDLDHIQAALGFPVIGNPDHSIPFALLAGVVMALVGPRKLRWELFAVGPIIFLAHLSFDLLGGWPVYQLMLPLNFTVFTVPTEYWVIFEALAICISVMITLSRWRKL